MVLAAAQRRRLLLLNVEVEGAINLPIPVEALGATVVDLAIPIESGQAFVDLAIPMESLGSTGAGLPLPVEALGATVVDLEIPVESLGLVEITTLTLPSGTVGEAYSETLIATGGAPPYTWALDSGALPDGLSLGASTGIISGTPTALGRFEFTIQVADDSGGTDTQAYTIVVGALPVLDGVSEPDDIEGVINDASIDIVTRVLDDEVSVVWRSLNPIELGAGESETVTARPTDRDTWMLEAVAPTADDYLSGGMWEETANPIPASAPANRVTGLAFGNGIWVATTNFDGSEGTIWTSDDDGDTWTQRTNPGTGAATLQQLVFANGIFMATSVVGYVLTSPDGITWTQRNLGGVTTLTLPTHAAFGDGRWMLVGGETGANTGMATSTDNGVNWSDVSFTSVPGNILRAVVYTGDPVHTWIAAGDFSTVHTSSSGTSWQSVSISGVPGGAAGILAMAYRADLDYVVLAGSNGSLLAGRPHPLSWERQPIPDRLQPSFLHALTALGAIWLPGVESMLSDGALLVNRTNTPDGWQLEPSPLDAIDGPAVIGASSDAVLIADLNGAVYRKALVALDSVTIGRTSGASIPITFTATATPTTVTQGQLRARALTLRESTTVRNTVDASASIAAHGIQTRRGRVSPDLSRSDARDLMDLIVTTYQGGLRWLSWPTVGKDAFSRAQVIAREIGDRVRVTLPRRGIDAEYILVQRDDEVTQGEVHSSRYVGIPAPEVPE